jgi:bile acid-coenzyme A ligase
VIDASASQIDANAITVITDDRPAPNRDASITTAIREHALSQPGHCALSIGDDGLCWSELEQRSDWFARLLADHGVNEGDFVAVSLPNGVPSVVSVCAIWALGATPLLVHSRLPEHELAAIFALAEPRAIVGSSKWPAKTPSIAMPAFDVPSLGTAERLPDRVSRWWRAATSGGSTGRPKVIVSELPGTARVAHAPQSMAAVRGDVALVPGPLYHTGPFMATFQALINGAQVVMTERFDAVEFLRTIEKHRVSWTLVVPTMMHRIMRLPAADRSRFDLSSLRVLLHSAAPCPVDLKRQFIDWLGPSRVIETYGSTEGIGSTSITGSESLERPASVGRPWSGTEVRILDDEARALPVGVIGRVFFRRPGQPAPYHYIGAEKSSIGEWETSGDLGHIDADGYLYLADRRTDLIISGGSNVYPMEVEAALGQHDAVESSLVVGLPDEDLGQRVHAVVRLNHDISDDALREFLQERLAPYKIPRSFERVDRTLRDEWGKARRFLYRPLSESPTGKY